MSDEPAGLYIHVPFCKTKCPYCDFYSITDLSGRLAWTMAAVREMSLYQERFEGQVFDSIYFGGGTPTLLEKEQLEELILWAFRHFSFLPDREVTLEANPDDLTLKKIVELRSIGFNRLSIGVQSFHEEELVFLGRRHSAAQAAQAINDAHLAGFDNIGLDLIYSFPGQTLDSRKETLQRALSFESAHLSCYQLTFEPSTAFGKLHSAGRLSRPGEEVERRFFLLTAKTLRDGGYIHYEVSNFARGIDFRSRHNRKYWRHVPYLAIGPGAHSFKDDRRWWNRRSVEGYCRSLERGEPPVEGSENLSPEQLRLEKLYLGFRTDDGVPLGELNLTPGTSEVLKRLIRSRYLRNMKGRVVATTRGYLIADRLPLMFAD